MGMHYLEFVMHSKGDEQWCGVVPGKALGWGKKVSGHSRAFEGSFYYCGRRGYGDGAIQVNGERLVRCSPVCDGDVIGALLDVESRKVAFARNDELQGSCN